MIGWDNGPMADAIQGETVDLTKLAEMVQAGMVKSQRHPSLPLSIYKYTPQAVYTSTWNEITLRCRGVVLDDEGNVVLNGFTKFFNHSEPMGAVVYEAHKGQPYEVTEKLDGSLIQAAKWNGNLIVTSSGSFTSPQAAEGAKMLDGRDYPINEGLSYLFEIIYPGNRIVLDYGDRRSLVLLAIRDTYTGHELELPEGNYENVKSVNLTLEEIEAELPRADYINKEGYIIRWADGQRVKMKYAEYMRLHKIVAGVNEKFVWEALRDGVDLEAALQGVPDELFQFVEKTTVDLRTKYHDLEWQAKRALQFLEHKKTRKEQAAYIMANHRKISQLVFCLLDGKDPSDKIWKMLEPETNTANFGKGES